MSILLGLAKKDNRLRLASGVWQAGYALSQCVKLKKDDLLIIGGDSDPFVVVKLPPLDSLDQTFSWPFGNRWTVRQCRLHQSPQLIYVQILNTLGRLSQVALSRNHGTYIY